MNAAAGWYPDATTPNQLRWWDGQAWTSHVAPTQPAATAPYAVVAAAKSDAAQAFGPQVVSLRDEIATLLLEKQRLEQEIVETREIFQLQEVGLYQYSHPLDSAAEYKDAIVNLEVDMQLCIKGGEAMTSTKKWAINGSEKDGARMVADFCKLMLRAYNTEADNIVRTLKPYALKAGVERLQKMRTSILKLGSSMKIEVTDKYHALRVKELELTADYLSKVAEEKEREREERARLKEEEAARREYEREQLRLEKERSHYEAALNALRMKGDAAGIEQAEQKLGEIQSAIEGVERRAANVRAGYVYVISNIGSFGERVVKIGMTRRLDPMDRVRELGDASVPFRFDVHAIIFSDDAVGLETALHQRFVAQRVNVVNAHREFFYVNPQQVKEALLVLQHHLLTFTEAPEALEWHQSEAARRAQSIQHGTTDHA